MSTEPKARSDTKTITLHSKRLNILEFLKNLKNMHSKQIINFQYYIRRHRVLNTYLLAKQQT